MTNIYLHIMIMNSNFCRVYTCILPDAGVSVLPRLSVASKTFYFSSSFRMPRFHSLLHLQHHVKCSA